MRKFHKLTATSKSSYPYLPLRCTCTLHDLNLPRCVCRQGASGITAAQLGKSAAGLAKPSPLKLIEEGVPKAKALAQLEQVGKSFGEVCHSADPRRVVAAMREEDGGCFVPTSSSASAIGTTTTLPPFFFKGVAHTCEADVPFLPVSCLDRQATDAQMPCCGNTLAERNGKHLLRARSTFLAHSPLPQHPSFSAVRQKKNTGMYHLSLLAVRARRR